MTSLGIGKTAGGVAAYIAVTMNDVKGLKCISRSGADLSEKDAYGNGIVHLACENGNEVHDLFNPLFTFLLNLIRTIFS